jgi:tetratricopeptide (TPR) repeat protein
MELADVYQRQGRSQDALRTYQRALSIDKKLVRAHFAIGKLQQAQGHRDEAIAAYTQVVQQDPQGGMGREAQNRLSQLKGGSLSSPAPASAEPVRVLEIP